MTLSTVLFFGTVLLVLGAAHYYLWARVVRDTQLSGRKRRWATGLIAAAFVLILPLWIVSRLVPREYLGVPAAVIFSWKGLVFYVVLLLLLWELVHVVLWLRRRTASRPEAPEAAAEDVADDARAWDRRRFIKRLAAGSAVAGGVAFGAAGVRSVLGEIETPEVGIRLPRLPRELSGYRIAVLSDLHLGPVIGGPFLEGVVARTNALKPDAVVVVGDLVDGPVDVIGRDVRPLAALEARDGVHFVTGNHEYYSGVASWMDHLDGLGVRVLRNGRVSLGDRHPRGASFDLAGVHDFRGGGIDRRHGPDLARALAGRDEERELVLLAHQPKQVLEAAGAGVGLQISGHTHGGQIWPFGLVTGLVQPYLAGHHHHTKDCQIYVSRGTGFWGPPMRVLAPPEITLLVLSA